MDAENTEFEENTFDIIHEYGALHHLALDAAFDELARIVKPDGCVVCTEALRHNPLIHAYRRRTPHLRTRWEAKHILGVPEINSARRCFSEVSLRFFHLFALAAVPFRKRKLFRLLLSGLNRVDSLVLRLPFVRRMAWIAVFVLAKPLHK